MWRVEASDGSLRGPRDPLFARRPSNGPRGGTRGPGAEIFDRLARRLIRVTVRLGDDFGPTLSSLSGGADCPFGGPE